MNGQNTLTYRREIDGLRAVAVLAVVLYHFGLPGLGGGFVGVDIFLVISGFLIGGILWDEWASIQDINLTQFFMRRIRRLAPAFFAMTTVTALFAYLILLPFEFKEFGKSLVAATAWVSNILFFRESGYFDIGSINKTLLHTWSLAVEEQFYLVLPLTLLLLRKMSKRTVVLLLVAAWASSLIACVALTPTSPTATFFLFPFRAWELLSGVLLSIWGKEHAAQWRYGSSLSWAGLLLLLGSLTLVRAGTQFPGWQALMPVVGTVLILLNGRHENSVNSALSSRIPVFIGLISYSLYLWHWPVLTLSSYWRGAYANGFEAAAWLLLAVALSVTAWALIERPLRRAAPNLVLITGFATAFTVTISIGLWAYLSNGAEHRFSEEARIHIEASSNFLSDRSRCSIASDGGLKGLEVCMVGPPGNPEVLFWGDSHLGAMMGGIHHAAIESKVPGLIVWSAGCPPLFGLAKKESAATPAQDQKCLFDNEVMRTAIADMDTVSRIVLVGRWSYYAEGKGTGLDELNRIELSASPAATTQGHSQSALYASAWQLTVAELLPHFDEIFVLRQVPEMPNYRARDIARKIVHDRGHPEEIKNALSVSNGALRARAALAETPISDLSMAKQITLVDTWPAICKPKCEVVHQGRSLYFDNNHLSNAGAMSLRDLFIPAFTGRKTR